MVARGFRSPLRLLWLIPDKVVVTVIREALVGFEGFSMGQRVLIIFGYLGVFAMLGLTLATEVLNERLVRITFEIGNDTKEIPLFVMIFSLIGLTTGWAFILTGGTDSRRRIFIPIALIFIVQFLLFMPINAGGAFLLAYGFGLLIAVVILFVYLATRGEAFWDRWPLLEFMLWLGVLGFMMTMFWFAENQEQRAYAMDANFSLLLLLTVIFWALAGLAVIDLSVRVAEIVIVVLRKVFPEEFLRVLTAALIIARPILTIIAFFIFGVVLDVPSDSIPAGAILFDMLFIIPLVLVMILTVVLRKWNTRNALTIMGLSFATPVMSLGIALSLFGGGRDVSDPLEMALAQTGILPDVIVFVGIMALSVLSVGASFSQSDGKYIPRSGRLMLGLGFALLVTTITYYGVNVREIAAPGEGKVPLEEFVDIIFMLSAVFLGTPYLAWIVWRRREALIGADADFVDQQPIFGGLRRVTGPVWMLGAVLAVIVPSCCLCLLTLVLAGANT